MPITKRNLHLAWLLVLAALFSPTALTQELDTAADDAGLDAFRIEPVEIAPFELRDHTGTSFNRKQLQGRWHLLMFGFTNCPDICPVHLTFLNQAWKQLEASGYSAEALPQVVMVSVDPDRDSLEHLAGYVAHFNQTFLGVTGQPEEIQALESGLGAGHRLFSPGIDGNYDVMHGSSVYLIDPQVRAVARFRPPLKAGRIAAAYHRITGGGRQ